ncbi:MAG: hypothetical protein V4628_08595 [Pseudomonadota bacterium]
MLETSPAPIFYPLIFLWSLLYGALAGAFFKLIAVYENWIAMNSLQIKLWKKFPQRSYNKYISSIWANQIKGKPVEFAEYTRQQIEKSHSSEPFPIFRLVVNTMLMIVIAPFMMLVGMFQGPVYVYRRAITRRNQIKAGTFKASTSNDPI